MTGGLRGAAKPTPQLTTLKDVAKWASARHAQTAQPRPKPLVQLAMMEARGVDRLVQKNKAHAHWATVVAKVAEIAEKKAKAPRKKFAAAAAAVMFAVGVGGAPAEPEAAVSPLVELARWECKNFPVPALPTEGMFSKPASVMGPCQLVEQL